MPGTRRAWVGVAVAVAELCSAVRCVEWSYVERRSLRVLAVLLRVQALVLCLSGVVGAEANGALRQPR